jgi:mutator protein MutT
VERISVVCGLIERDGKLLAARRPFGASNGGLWELPGGKVKEGETPQQALAREIAEEFGLSSRVGEHFGASAHSAPDRTIELAAYRCEVAVDRLRCIEHAEIRWVGPQEAIELEWTPADIPLVRKWCRGRR